MSGNPSTPKPVIKVYAAQHAQQDPVARERMERVVAAFGGVLVGEPSPEYAVWLVADTQLRLHGATHYRDLEWQDEYVLCCGPNHHILEVPEGAATIHIPTANNKSIYNDQAIALTLEYLYASS
jgi:hypothetical protein